MARTPKTAARKARKHRRVIDEQPDEIRKLRRAWSWVLSELKHQPQHTDHAIRAVTDLAQTLNEGGPDARNREPADADRH